MSGGLAFLLCLGVAGVVSAALWVWLNHHGENEIDYPYDNYEDKNTADYIPDDADPRPRFGPNDGGE